MEDDNKMLTMFGLANFVTKQILNPPANGTNWEVFPLQPLKDKVSDAQKTDDWQPAPRHKRQRGKVAEAEDFRRAHGFYLKARLHFWKISQRETGYLKWWFSDLDRVLVHHVLMTNYYLENRPTLRSELEAEEICSKQKLHQILKTAVEMGSVESDKLAEDTRKSVYYVTRGLVTDTDALFGRRAGGDEDNEGIYRHWNRSLRNDPKRAVDCAKTPQMLDNYLKKYDNYIDMVAEYIPDIDTDRYKNYE